jgi:peptide/nickel transport system substrate-binding protein
MNVFNNVYYSFSPQVADYEREQPWLQATIKVTLYPLFGILMAAERVYTTVGGGEAGAIFAGTISSMLIGAVYLGPIVYIVTRGVKVESKLLAIIFGAATVGLVITLVTLNVLLPLSTVAFVIAVAGVSSLTVAKAIRYVVHKG